MRRKDREITDINEILGLCEKAKILHLGLFDGTFPYVVPLHYGYEYADNQLVFFMHSAKEGHKLDLIRENPHVCIELDCDAELLEAGDEACKYSSTFASVIGRGTAELVEDEQEKVRGLKILMKTQTGRDFVMDGKMAASVAVIKVTLQEFTAKAKKK